MKYKNRLFELRGNLSQKEFAERIGLTQQNYANYENGKQGLKSDLIAKICETFGCSAEWLLELDSPGALPPNAIIPKPSRRATAPLLGRVHAGDAQEPDILEDEVELPWAVAQAHPRGYFLQVEGDCMDEVYPEGCYILVDPDREPANGSIAAVAIDGREAVMRRMLRTASTMVLAPESTNPNHADIVITASDEKTVELIGTVVWFQAAKEME